MTRKRLFIIDAAGFYYRAFYGLRLHLSAPDGTPTNAVYAFNRMLAKIMKEEKPDLLVVALDSKGKTFRHELYADYKANRQAMPEELAVQIPLIEQLIDAYNLPVLKRQGLEADDLIGHAALHAADAGYSVTIFSGDKDLMQLVGGHIAMFDPIKEKPIGPAEVKEKFGVAPPQVADVLALMGDSSDNIPGVPGIGEKTAQALIAEYRSVENLLAHAAGIKKPKLKAALTEHADTARLCKVLATVKTDLDLPLDYEAWHQGEPDTARLAALFEKLGFKTFLAELGQTSAPAAGRETPVPSQKEIAKHYQTIYTEDELAAAAAVLKHSGGFAVDTETTSTNPVDAALVGISLCAKEGEAWYLPLAHDYLGAPAQLPKGAALKMLKPLLEDAAIPKYGQNLKYDITVLAGEGISVNPVGFDTMVASYLTAPEERRHGLSYLAQKYLGLAMIEYADVAGKGAKQVTFNQVSIDRAAEYSAEDADMAYRLTGMLKAEIEAHGLNDLYYTIEQPLIGVLAQMEQNGIKLDVPLMKGYSRTLEKKLKALEKDIHAAAGEEFNIASPKQLSAILFDKLGLAKQRKTKTGSSTDQAALETLAMEHPLPALMLRHRVLSKLKSTYVDPLPEMVSAKTGRIHTSFNQAATATGRLSSSDPNLQNIPVRTEEGREIRRAFVAEKGCLLISADYSQIELRILAHLSGDALLTESFKNDEDVHTRTAREIFGAIGGASPEMRRAAKAVNFGIIYGQTAFGLARELAVSRREAQGYIDGYFARYRGVREFIDAAIKKAHKERMVRTMYGRKRSFPDIGSVNRAVREMAERMAVNTVVQGSAADLIKKAMLDIAPRLAALHAKMLLQVHDELIFEAPEKNIEKVKKAVRELMEKAAPLSVPLKVSVESAPNWGDMH
ncbi:MAG: DNA polymerase I [Nitrospinae bacterium]|nr:DNA polymerase I [Nitrospinota bacterium]